MDESDHFYADPLAWIQANVDRERTDTVVLFEALLPTVEPWLLSNGYRECARFFNAHFTDDGRRAGAVLAYCRAD